MDDDDLLLPYHGSLDRSEPINITRNDLTNAKLKFNKKK
tara:strand:+ start:198 stop:314 length:117 start_codon:yes stop_codon:yes gene_type:complete